VRGYLGIDVGRLDLESGSLDNWNDRIDIGFFQRRADMDFDVRRDLYHKFVQLARLVFALSVSPHLGLAHDVVLSIVRRWKTVVMDERCRCFVDPVLDELASRPIYSGLASLVPSDWLLVHRAWQQHWL